MNNKEATDEKFNIVGLVVNCSPDSQDSVVEQLIGVNKRCAVITDNRNDIDLINEMY